MYISHNGKLMSCDEAKISVANIEWTYGFGVYENLKVRNGRVYFISEHIERLFNSARLIELKHNFEKKTAANWISELAEKNEAKDANVKMILIGGDNPELYIMTLAPKFLDKKYYRQGVHAITKQYERYLPQAKTLNMLPSYLMFREAKKTGAHDCLLIDRGGNIIEGTRSNFFAVKDKTLFTAPAKDVLNGVTRQTVITCATAEKRFEIIEQSIKLKEIGKYDGAFLTHTNGKIVPIKSIDNFEFPEIHTSIKNLIKLYNNYLEQI